MSYRVLLIEDDTVLADALRMKLERDGLHVTIAPNQRDAYHRLDKESFEFALLDLRLPTHAGDMDPNSQVGFDILKHIRERFRPDQLPIVVMTAYEETSQTAVRALRLGANDYITKPFEDSVISLDAKLRDIVACIEGAKAERGAKELGDDKACRLVFSGGRVKFKGIEVPGKSGDLLLLLGSRTLMLSTARENSSDRQMPGKAIAKALGVEEGTVRKHVSRLRKWIAAEHERQGLGRIDDQAVIRNDRNWKGYELNLERCDLSVS